MLKKNAQHILDDLIEKQTHKFCPISNSLCRQNCVCFEGGILVDHEEDGKPDDYHYSHPYCSCYMLHGVRDDRR